MENKRAGEWLDDNLSYDTQLVHAGTKPDEITGAILTPIQQSTTFVQKSIEEYLATGYSQSRTNNPTVESYSKKVAKLENGQGATLFNTGMAATVTLMSTLLKSGDHVVITECSYGGTNRACRVQFFEHYNIEQSFVDFTNLNKIEEAIIKNRTKLLMSESPANPLLTLADISAISDLAHKYDIKHACDSTFATPIINRPMDFGADYVFISLTKYQDGHNMTTGGAVICKNKDDHEKIRLQCNIHGNIMTPQVAFMQMQTSKTMGLRLERQSKNAMKIAEFLETHPNVLKVAQPGLKSFPQKQLADKQHQNNLHGGMLWFDVKGGTTSGTKLMNTTTRPWSLCENLGATESIITACAIMTHANMLKEDREKLGIGDGFIRLSVGIEDVDDLIRSLKNSLDNLL